MEAILSQIPFGLESFTVIVAVAALISAIVPDEKMPEWLSKIINTLALNVGKAKNQSS
jgi:hypothetical protein